MNRSFPTPIETRRLRLRAPRAGDGPETNQAVRETFAQLRLWMDWADHVPDVEETTERCRQAGQRFQDGSDFTVQARLKHSDTLVVRAGLHPVRWDVPSFEIGYWCRARFQGMGYVTETVRALIAIGFNELAANRLEIRCDPRNQASRRVAESCGFVLEGVLRNEQIGPDGRLRDTCVYVLLPSLRGQHSRSVHSSVLCRHLPLLKRRRRNRTPAS